MNHKNYMYVWGLGALFALSSCSSELDIPEAPVYNRERSLTVTLNQEFQTIDGFGASDAWRCQMVGRYWPEEKKNAIADWLFSHEFDENGNPKGIGLSMWRFYIGSGSMEQGAESGIADEWRRAECFQSADGTYDWEKQAGQRWFLRAARDRGVGRFLAFSLSAPVHMSLNGKGFSTPEQRMNIQEGKMPAYADFLVDCIENLQKKEGVTFNYLSPVNEPQWDWSSGSQEGTPVTNEEMHQFVTLLSERLSQRGLSTTIALGEAGSINYLYQDVNAENRDNQIEAFWNPSSSLSIASLPNVEKVMTGHSYWSVWPLEDMISHRRNLNTKIGTYSGLKYWQTEYCPMESPGTSEVPNGDGNVRDLGMQTALYVARIIHHDLTYANASSWQWWTALTRANYKDGLIYLDDGNSEGGQSAGYCKEDGYARDSKLMWAFGNYSFFVRPGMKRVAVTTDSSDPLNEAKDVMISAYKDEAAGKLVIVAVNIGKVNREYHLNTDCKLKNQTLVPYVTSENSNLAKGTEMPVDELSIPARSVVTFVGEIE